MFVPWAACDSSFLFASSREKAWPQSGRNRVPWTKVKSRSVSPQIQAITRAFSLRSPLEWQWQ
jgi:hypothetical protein